MFRKLLTTFMMIFVINLAFISNPSVSTAQVSGEVPGKTLGLKSDADLWRYIRTGNAGSTQMKDELSAVMIQSEGDNWRAIRNGPVSLYGGLGLLGIIGLLFVFYMYRGKIKVETGLAGQTILRFAAIDRFAHWLMAGSFVLLSLTGLNLLYGKYVLLPILGPETFTAITIGGKYIHNYLAFAFMLGLVLAFVLWVRHNIPTKIDWEWLKMGGGIFKAGMHPPAKKFNAGQKMIFWITMIGGLSVSMSGIALMFPFQTTMFADTFALLNADPPPAPTRRIGRAAEPVGGRRGQRRRSAHRRLELALRRLYQTPTAWRRREAKRFMMPSAIWGGVSPSACLL